jgi:hypothetical protein
VKDVKLDLYGSLTAQKMQNFASHYIIPPTGSPEGLVNNKGMNLLSTLIQKRE